MATRSINAILIEESRPKRLQFNAGLLRHTAIYGFASLVAYGLSMLKAIIVGRLFGTSAEMDAYTVATLTPNLAGALISSTVAGALVPILAKAEEEGEEIRATVFRSSLAIFCTGSLVITLLLLLFVSPLANLLGATFDPYRLSLTVSLSRSASVLVVSTGIYAVCSAELLARRRYWSVGLAPAFGTAISLLLILGVPKPDVDLLVWSLVAGTVAQAGMLLVPAWHSSRGGLLTRWRHEHVRKSLAAQLTLVGAATIGVANGFIDQMFAARLPSGSVSVLNYASTFNTVVMQAVVMSLACVALPDFSKLVAIGELERLRCRVQQGVILAAMLAAPASLAILTFGRDTIRIVLQHGRFGADSTEAVFSTWVGYTLGLLPAAMGMIVARLFNSLGKNIILFRIGAVLLVANTVLDYSLMHLWGLFGLTFGTTCVYIASSITLFTVAKVYLGMIIDRHTLYLSAKALIGSLTAILPITAWRIWQPSSLIVMVLQAGLFLLLVIATYIAGRLLRFHWHGANTLHRAPFYLTLDISI